MNKNISKTKLFLAFISIIITFFVWQKGLRDSLSRPSVSFDISQKEKEIVELALPAIPSNFKNAFITNDPIEDIKTSLSEIPFDELTERNKLIRIISTHKSDININNDYLISFDNESYKLVIENLSKRYADNTYQPKDNFYALFKEDRFLYHLLSKIFEFDDSQLITNTLSKKMFLRIIAIRLIPLLTIVTGSLLVLRTLWSIATR